MHDKHEHRTIPIVVVIVVLVIVAVIVIVAVVVVSFYDLPDQRLCVLANTHANAREETSVRRARSIPVAYSVAGDRNRGGKKS